MMSWFGEREERTMMADMLAYREANFEARIQEAIELGAALVSGE